MTRRRGHLALLAAAVAAVLAASLAVAGCGDATKTPTPTTAPTVSLPTGNVEVPAGVTLTAPGTRLEFGQAATVAYEPNAKRRSVLQLVVRKVVRGSVADLSGYVLDARTRASTPYYVTLSVRNVGTGDVGRTDIPVWAVDKTNTLIHASSFTNSFAKCPSRPLPATFAPKASLTTCQLYLVPDHGTLVSMSFRPLQAFEPILWEGPVASPVVKHPPKKKKS